MRKRVRSLLLQVLIPVDDRDQLPSQVQGAWKVRELFKLDSAFDRFNTIVQAFLSPAMSGLSVCLALIYWNLHDLSLSVMMLLPLVLFAISSVALDLAAMGYKFRRERIPKMIMMSVLQCVQLRLTWASFYARCRGMLPSSGLNPVDLISR
jgi:hypothetical protein